MEAAAARKEDGVTGAGGDDRRRDAVREAKKGMFFRGVASIPPLRPHATARGVLRRSGSGRAGESAPARCGAGPIRMGWGSACVAASRRPGAAVQCGARGEVSPGIPAGASVSSFVSDHLESAPVARCGLSLLWRSGPPRSPDVAGGGGPGEATVLSGVFSAARMRLCDAAARENETVVYG